MSNSNWLPSDFETKLIERLESAANRLEAAADRIDSKTKEGQEGIGIGLHWEGTELPPSWENRGGVFCKSRGPATGFLYEINYWPRGNMYRVFVNGIENQYFKTDEEARGWRGSSKTWKR